MGDLVQASRTTARGPAQAPPGIAGDASAPVAQMMNASPRVQALTAQRALLNGKATPLVQRVAGADAPAQLMPGGGKDKKSKNQKAQDKKKATAEGKKKAKARKEDKAVKSAMAYDSGKKKGGEQEVRAAVRRLQAEGKKLPGGHRSGTSGDGMNDGTKKGNALIHAAMKETAKREKDEKRAARSKKDDSDVDDSEEEVPDFDDFDPDDTGRKDFDPGKGGGGGMGGASLVAAN